MKLLKKGSATALAASMLLTCAAASACAHTHDYTEWKYSTTQHWKICAADGEIGEDARGPHDFSGSSTCKCGYLMGSEIDYGDHTHSYTRWGYNSSQHWKECPDDFEADVSSYAEHSYVDGVCVCGRTDGASSEGPVTPPPGATHTVTFVTNCAQTYDPQSVSSGSTVLQPTGLTNGNKYIAGWYTTENFAEGTQFNFARAITRDYTLYAKWADLDKAVKALKSYNESLAVEFEDANPSAATVQYKPVSGGNYVTVDKELVRSCNGAARVDIVGLKAGSYSVKITTSGGSSFDIPEVNVSAYDRSGYAHFKYDKGVGAYNDDGTLKDNAVVIYVTNENKDTVMEEVAEKYSAVNMFQIPYYAASGGKNWENKNASGIGWWLNNNQYTANNESSSKSGHRPSNTYDPANGKNLGLRSVNAPVAVRFIGKVTAPEGLSVYNGWDEGGIAGDNGAMARMKNLANVTLEGIGEDAEIRGWGFHFIAGTDRNTAKGEGESFEVRNLIFNEYPEDAIGMEGQQSGSTITAPVSRCWIHHNVFLPGRCDNPAESDKSEGDGSCDFKRGEYFTCSYNYYEYCHKTNLVGSSDSSLQYNMTYHHNMWYQCSSRIPLTRQANVHFYNNYVCGDSTEKTAPYSHIKSLSLSYVHSLRANCYIFTEGNYYEGCKNVTEKDGGVAKGWNNMYYANIGTNSIVEAAARDQIVSSNNKYASFEINSDQFYYNTEKKKSDCLLDDPASARIRVLREAGVNGFKTRIDENMIKDSDMPAAAINVPQGGLTIDVSKATLGGTVDGVKFINAKNSSGKAKGKGVLATFTVEQNVEITLTSGGSGITGCELVKSDGTVIAGGIDTYTGVVTPGTYFISSSQKDKDGFIVSLSFKQGTTEADVIEYIDAIGEVTLSPECAAKIQTAQAAYNALTAAQQAKVTNAATLTAAATKYNGLVAEPVIALINAIGTVNEDSGTKIAAARNAYNNLNAAQKQLVTNYGTLTAAESAYENYEVAGVNKAITNLADPSTAATEAQIRSLLAEYETVDSMYGSLDPSQKTQVTGYSKVTSGIAALESKLAPFAVRDMIAALPAKANVTMTDAEDVREARAAYDALTAAQKTSVGDITKLTDAEAVIKELSSQAVVAIFTKSNPSLAANAGFTVTGTIGYKGTSQTFTYDGTNYDSPLKMQSSNTVTFNTEITMTLTLYLHSDGSQNIKVDGTSYAASGGLITVTVGAGSHTIGRDGEAWLCYATLTPAA